MAAIVIIPAFWEVVIGIFEASIITCMAVIFVSIVANSAIVIGAGTGIICGICNRLIF